MIRVARSIAARNAPAVKKPGGHRVPPKDYRANLRRLIDTARAHGAAPVVLTRPYRLPTATLRAADGWRGWVPRYNRLLLDLAARHRTLTIDVQAAFEAVDEDFVDECHFSPAGHQKMADLLADALIEAGLVS